MDSPRRVQCGAPDCKRLWHNERNRKWQKEYKEKTGTQYNYSMPSRPQRKSNTHCVDCGKPVAWGRTQETRCRACGRKRNSQRRAEQARQENEARKAAEWAKWNSRPERARRKLIAAAVGVAANTSWPVAEGPCQRCGVRFACRVTKEVPRFCSIQCARLDAKATRRARQRGVKLTPARRWLVYERDGWLCQICGRPINRAVPAPHPMSASIDHVIPLDLGGAHCEENWQCAHFICNSIKGCRLLEVSR